MELACESVDFGQTIEREPNRKKVLKAGVPCRWIDVDGFPRTVVPATSMEVSPQKKMCSIVVYGQVLVTAEQTEFASLPGHFVHNPKPCDGAQTHEFFMTSPY